MKTIFEKSTQTPLVTYDNVNKKLKLEGNIIGIDISNFWKDITKEIIENSNLKSVDFDLEYINTVSIRELLFLLKNQSVSGLEINWLYMGYDDDMKELAENIQTVTSKKINLIEK